MNIDDLKGKRFIASYSGGKDSVFAVYKALNAGLEALEMITTYRTDMNRSWFHGISRDLVRQVSDSISIPIRLIETTGDEYESNFELALTDAKNRGAEVCVFGDIDIEGHLEWCTQRCEKTGLIPFFPLWQENRKKLVYSFIEAGFKTLITVVDTSRMSKSFLGKVMTRELADEIEKSGADICGENGEYHTFTFDGPIFSYSIKPVHAHEFTNGDYAILEIR